MGLLYSVLVVLHIFMSVFLIIVVLLQAGKGAGLAGLFGSGVDNVFGGQGVDKPLSIFTTICAALFMVTCLSLSYMSRSGVSSSVTDKLPANMPISQQSAPQPQGQAPVRTAPQTQVPAAAPVQAPAVNPAPAQK